VSLNPRLLSRNDIPMDTTSTMWLAATFLVAACSLAACAEPPPPVVESDFFLGGIQVNEPDLDAWLDALAVEGMNTVAVTAYAKHGDWDTDNLWWSDDDFESLLPEVRAAHARGMKVVLVLRVALDHAFERNRFLWHGMIMPRTDAQLDEWFRRYGELVTRWAEIAEREGVDVLMIGSEMNALASTVELAELPSLEEYFLDETKQEERREQLLGYEGEIEERHLWLRGREHYPDLAEYLEARMASEEGWAAQVTEGGPEALARVNERRRRLERKWVEVIGAAREVYHGKLGYAANFDQYQMVSFWGELDLMGINAYFPLRRELLTDAGPDELYATLVEGWSRVLGEIRDFRAGQGLTGRNVMFTELGYTWRANCTIEPWADTGFSVLPVGEGEKLVVWQDQEPDPRERALAVRALHEAHRRLAEAMLAGILYWKLSTVEEHREIEAFVLHVGGPSGDPLAAELRRFTGS